MWNLVGGVHTEGGGNGNGNDVVMEWVVDPFGGSNVNGKKEIYIYMILCRYHCHPPQCEHSHLIPLDPFHDDIIAARM